MVQVIVMPKLGLNQDEGVLVTWYKKEGESVKKGEPFFAIETDKTTMDMEATGDGVVRKLLCEEGETVPVTVPIVIVAAADEDISDALAQAGAQLQPAEAPPEAPPEPKPEPKKRDRSGPKVKEQEDPSTITRLTGEAVYNEIMKDMQEKPAEPAASPVKKAAASTSGIIISPRARGLAAELGLDLNKLANEINGTGYEGGICEADVRNYAKSAKTTPVAKAMAAEAGLDIYGIGGSGSAGRVMKRDVKRAIERQGTGVFSTDGKEILEEVPYKGVRRIIGERLAQSMSDAPHVFFTQKVDMSALLKTRKYINDTQEQKTSVTDYIALAVIIALQKYPELNSSLIGDKIFVYSSVNLGIAVAAPGGLIVPVVKEAQKLTFNQLAAESSALVAKARESKLSPEEYTGGTFTISNLGMFGVDNFTAIINPPEAGILAVSAVKDEAVVVADDDTRDKKIEIRPMMNIQLSADHRVADGLLAAQFVTEIQKLLEAPIGMFI